MKSKAKLLTIISVVLMLNVLLFTSCSDSNITKSVVTEQNSYSEDEITFLEWNDDIAESVQTLDKTRLSASFIPRSGGVMATQAMFGAELIIPANAFSEPFRFILAVATCHHNRFAGIEFLPSQQFDKNVTIQVPLSAVKLKKGVSVNDIRGFWYNNETHQWVEIPNVTVDEANQVIITEIDHFTRFGWGL